MRPGDCVNCGHSRNEHGIPTCGNRRDLFANLPGTRLDEPCPCDTPAFLGSLDYRPQLAVPQAPAIEYSGVNNGRGGQYLGFQQCGLCGALVAEMDVHSEWHEDMG